MLPIPHSIVFALVGIFLCVDPAFGQTEIQLSDKDKRSQALGHYIAEHGDHVNRESRKIAWYADSERKIRNSTHYKTLTGKTVTCSMLLKENGQIEKATIIKSSGTKTIDDEALACIRDAALLSYGALAKPMPRSR